jgi:hypothetical protein
MSCTRTRTEADRLRFTFGQTRGQHRSDRRLVTPAVLGDASVSLPKTQRLPVGARPWQACPHTQRRRAHTPQISTRRWPGTQKRRRRVARRSSLGNLRSPCQRHACSVPTAWPRRSARLPDFSPAMIGPERARLWRCMCYSCCLFMGANSVQILDLRESPHFLAE